MPHCFDSTTGLEKGRMANMSVAEIARRWSSRTYGALTVWSVLPQGIVAVIAAYLGAGVHWISQLGAFGIFMSGLAGFVLASFGLAQAAKWRLFRVEAKNRERLIGDGSPFDPMARVYENKRLYLRDLAPLGRRQVRGKTFINCEIIGPGTAVLLLLSDPTKPPHAFTGNNTFDVDCIEIDTDVKSYLAIEFWDCHFTDCNFYQMSLLFLARQNKTLHWITKDSRQAMLTAEPVGILENHAEQPNVDQSGN